MKSPEKNPIFRTNKEEEEEECEEEGDKPMEEGIWVALTWAFLSFLKKYAATQIAPKGPFLDTRQCE